MGRPPDQDDVEKNERGEELIGVHHHADSEDRDRDPCEKRRAGGSDGTQRRVQTQQVESGAQVDTDQIHPESLCRVVREHHVHKRQGDGDESWQPELAEDQVQNHADRNEQTRIHNVVAERICPEEPVEHRKDSSRDRSLPQCRSHRLIEPDDGLVFREVHPPEQGVVVVVEAQIPDIESNRKERDETQKAAVHGGISGRDHSASHLVGNRRGFSPTSRTEGARSRPNRLIGNVGAPSAMWSA